MRAPEGTPLYVHLPYCVVKCTYCDFYSVAAEGEDLDGMIDAVLDEARQRAPREPRTVFFGGGTPSLLSGGQLRRLLDGLDEITDFRRSATEVTAECNPESLDRDKAETLLELGVDRLSIGIQALDPAALALFGRVHDADQGLAALGAARAAGVARLSADLIYAWPGQTLAGWERDLTRVLESCRPDHLSAYNLTFEPGTQLTSRRDRGELSGLSEDLELELFDSTRRIAKAYGLDAYEISNFASNGQQCAHNVNYWHNGPYLGLGPSAVSKVGQTRAGNPRSVGRWRQRVAGAEGPSWSETPEAGVRLGETWWLGLRLADGVNPEDARRTAGWDLRPETCPDPALIVARELEGQGLLERTGATFRLSPRGLPLADAVASRFLDQCSRVTAKRPDAAASAANQEPAPHAPEPKH